MSDYSELLKVEVVEQTPQTHAAHPLKNDRNHRKLLDYLLARVQQGKNQRDSRVTRLVATDRAVAGWIQLSEEDKQRELKRFRTGKASAIMQNLPVAFIQMDDLMTYLLETFSPGRGMFYHTSKPDETDAVNPVVMLMNNHAIYAQYYVQLARALWSILKYNFGGLRTDWEEELGSSMSWDANGNMITTQKVVWNGNCVKWLDPYNSFWDSTTAPEEVFKSGEYAGHVEIMNQFQIARLAENGEIFNIKSGLTERDAEMKFYRSPPNEVLINKAYAGLNDNGPINWVSALGGAYDYDKDCIHEVVKMQIRLRPKQFGLLEEKAAEDKFEVWEFWVLNGKRVIKAKRKVNAHGHISHYYGLVNDDGLGVDQKSVADFIDPLQSFMSHLMNAHVLATRKQLKGLTIYDPSIVDLSEIPEGEVSANVPAKQTGYGKDLTKAIWQDKNDANTQSAVRDIEALMGMMNTFFPMQAAPSQIAGIDRAVSNQVAAVQHGSNRRSHKMASMIDSTMLIPMRHGLFYNILQFYTGADAQKSDYRGREMNIDVQALRNTDTPMIIGMGLKSIDRMMIAGEMQKLIFSLIQNPNSAARIDVLRMMDYWSSMLDIDIDFKSFELQQQPAPAGPAAPGAQGGTGILPATNPDAVTAPIFG